MPDKMDNPYEKFGAHRCEVTVGHGWSWVLTFLFLVVCTLPPFWRNVHQFFQGPNGWTPVAQIFDYSRVGDETLYEHLRRAEKRIEDADFTEAPRRALQSIGTAIFREGNRKTAIGREGWLYFRPAIDAVTGYGPLEPEPDTVAKDPTRKPWRGPLEAILHFDRQLDQLGVELILVPIPVKPMIYPEYLSGRTAEKPITHPDAGVFFEKLREGGVDVLDLSESLFDLKSEVAGEDGAVFLKQDTHWTPRGMRASAKEVADFVRQRPWFGALESKTGGNAGDRKEVVAPGDLVVNLELEETGIFDDETAGIEPIAGVRVFDQSSPVVLLGDSFTNIYHQADMDWGEKAGFAEHLSRALGLPLDTIAQNGQASTGVRRTLALRPFAEKMMREKKKAVVWAIAARDLFLSETVARSSKVSWGDVEFNTGDPAAEVEWPVVMDGTISKVSTIPDPASVPYKDSLYVVEYKNLNVIEGRYPIDGAVVFHWAFRDKKRLPSAYYKVGDRHRLELEPFHEQPQELRSQQSANDSDRFDLPQAWAETVAVLERGEGGSRSEQSAARIASIATVIFALILGTTILAIFRRKSTLRRSRPE